MAALLSPPSSERLLEVSADSGANAALSTFLAVALVIPLLALAVTRVPRVTARLDALPDYRARITALAVAWLLATLVGLLVAYSPP